MDFDIGIACGKCDTFNPMGDPRCGECGHDLTLGGIVADSQQPAAAAHRGVAVAPQPPSEEELMEQARNYVCRECSTPVPSGHKFCGTCGAAVPVEVVELQTNYFGSMQTPGKARLILIRGDSGVDGLSYMLQGTQHLAGREDGQILFPEDPWLSPRHANFVYEQGQLMVRDEGSLNGVYVRVRDRVPLTFGSHFICGEQLFRLDEPAPDTAGPSPDQTYFYSSPRKQYTFRLVQVVAGGAEGLVYCASTQSVTIGREDCDINFPLDVYMSGEHAKIEMGGNGSFTLLDSESKNGTYVRISNSAPLHHGDYLFLGKQLLRVEMTA